MISFPGVSSAGQQQGQPWLVLEGMNLLHGSLAPS